MSARPSLDEPPGDTVVPVAMMSPNTRLTAGSSPSSLAPAEAYARAIVHQYGQLLSLADVLDGESGPNYRELRLEDIFISPAVREIATAALLPDAKRGDEANELELTEDHFKTLDEVAAASPEKARLPRRRPGRKDSQHPVELVPLLDNLKLHGRLVILGAPGAGKSSVLRQRLLRWATATIEQRMTLPVPVLVELKQLAEKKYSGLSDRVEGEQLRAMSRSLSLAEYVVRGGSVHVTLDPTWLQSTLESNSGPGILVMLDGLDEVINLIARRAIVADVTTFANSSASQESRIVLTSRIVGYNAIDMLKLDFAHYSIPPLSLDQVDVFLERWHAATYAPFEAAVSSSRKGRLREAIVGNPSMRTLAENPLLLTLMCIVNRTPSLPTRRVRLYEKCVELLLARWKVEEAVAAGSAVSSDLAALDPDLKAAMLRDLAYRMIHEKELGNVVSRDVLEDVLNLHISRSVGSAHTTRVTEGLLMQLRARHGIISFLGGSLFAFVHRTFLEYFLALHYRREWHERSMSGVDLENLFRKNAHVDSWNEVLVLVSGMMPSGFIAPCLDILLDKNAEKLAMACVLQLESRHSAIPAVCRVLCRAARSDDASIAGEAVIELVRIDSSEVTRQLLHDVIVAHSAGTIEAISEIARAWCAHKDTRSLLERAAQSGGFGAEAAVSQLALLWPTDDAAYHLLLCVAESCKFGASEAIAVLARGFLSHERTQQILRRVSTFNSKFGPEDAVREFARYSQRNDSLQAFLMRIAQSRESSGASAAVSEICRLWPNEASTRVFLFRLCESSANGAAQAVKEVGSFRDVGGSRPVAGEHLRELQELLLRVAATSDSVPAAAEAMQALSKLWPTDPRVRKVLVGVATSDRPRVAQVAKQQLDTLLKD